MGMDNIRFISSTGPQQSAPANKKIMDKDDFLRLLVTKLSNQNPMNPIDDEDFIAQLAQFSTLEQMENMNRNLTEDLQWNYLLSQTISNTMSTSLIGRTVRADSSQVYLKTGGSTDINLTLQEPASEVTITIRDENGQAIRTITSENSDRGNIVIEWDGLTDNGVQAASGFYTVSAEAVGLNGNDFKPGLYVEGRVKGVTYNNGVAYLSIEGQDVPLGSVLEVKEG